MTEVWIHLGTEKTGSSALQSHCALGREDLQAAGVWFAQGARFDERCMRKGLISAGNARVLAQKLEADEWAAARNWLAKAFEQARNANCSRLLLSSELLLAPIADAGRLAKFAHLLQEIGAVNTNWLLLLRDPVAQFLSLYKHRAKRGTIGAINVWAKTGYRLPGQLHSLRRQLSTRNFEFAVRQYTRDSGGLQKLFFVDWLGVPIPSSSGRTEVNPSLTLSELVLIRQIAALRPELVNDLYDRLLRIPRNAKAQGDVLNDFCTAVAARSVADYSDEWEHWNDLLPDGEKLNVPKHPQDVPERPSLLEFSEAQLGAVTQLLADSNTVGFNAQILWRQRIRPFLGQIKRLLAAPLARITRN